MKMKTFLTKYGAWILVGILAIMMYTSKKEVVEKETIFTIEKKQMETVLDSLIASRDSLVLVTQNPIVDTVYTEPQIKFITRVKKDTVTVRDTIWVKRQVQFQIPEQTFWFHHNNRDSLGGFEVSWETVITGITDLSFDKYEKLYSQTEIDCQVRDFKLDYTIQNPLVTSTVYKAPPLIGIVYSEYSLAEEEFNLGFGMLYKGKFWGSVNTSGTFGIGYQFSPKTMLKRASGLLGN